MDVSSSTSASPGEASRPFLRAHGIVRRYNGVPVLRGLDLTADRGEIVVVYGPNGAGKTTLLRILASLIQPHEGTLALDGEDYEERAYIRARLMYCGHGTQIYEDLEPEENLRFFLALYGRAATDAELKDVLERVGLWRVRHLRAAGFSAGMKRRLSFARAMLLRPPLLLLDEPYTSLDAAGIEMVNDFLRDHAAAGNTVVMSSHSPELVRTLPHRAVRIRAGVLAADSDSARIDGADHVA